MATNTDILAAYSLDESVYFRVAANGDVRPSGGLVLPTGEDLDSDRLAMAAITVAGGTSGATAGTMTIQLNRTDEATAVGRPLQAMVIVSETQYAPGTVAISDTVTFGTATAGTKVAAGSGWCLFETTSAGVFTCPPSNSADETVYFRVVSLGAVAGASDPTDAAIIVGSAEAAATWAA